MLSEIFLIPVLDKILLHAPLHGVTALVNYSAAKLIHKEALQSEPGVSSLSTLSQLLREPPFRPMIKKGKLTKPLFLGLIPTRGCNMFCRYCDFPVSKTEFDDTMSIETCQNAIDAYFDLLKQNHSSRANIHFFGGEPFFVPELVFFAVEYANGLASQNNMLLHVEASTNGLIEGKFREWVAERFDSIVLSFDGRESTQNFLRPKQHLIPSYNHVYSTANTLSKSLCNLILRRCIPQASLSTLVETSLWMAQEFQPSAICLEPLSESERSERFGIQSPDPWEFAKQFLLTEVALRNHGVECVLSTADLSMRTLSSCPVGHDALIISPDGSIDACYLVKESWQKKGMEMNIGQLSETSFQINQDTLDAVRSYQVENKQLCQQCFCRYHCAGGCHINHPGQQPTAEFDDLCIRTRLVTIGKLLLKIDQPEIFRQWVSDIGQMELSSQQKSDRLEDWKI